MVTDSNILEVRINNSENSTDYFLYVRKDRLEAFYTLVYTDRFVGAPQGMPGLSWSAMLGLDAIFEKRPRKFPVYDIITWLYTGCVKPGLTRPELEKALEQFATMYPPDVAETA